VEVASKPQTLTVDALTASWINNSIRPNPEYQRGATWRLRQKQLLIDSVLRGYPLPRFYFEKRVSRDVLGNLQTSLDVIDGQQRLIALSEFREDAWALFDIDDERVPLPPSIRRERVPWSGRVFSALPERLQAMFLGKDLPVVLIDQVTGDEVRDLFIRLQSGTPLTAQQVRDAWPGNIGPFIERLAGKRQRQGKYHRLFAAIDRRGAGGRSEDEYEDPALDARQTCAQLLLLLLNKEKGRGFPSLRSTALNDLYHENTEFDTNGRTAELFDELLADVEAVMLRRPEGQGRKAVRKNRVLSLFLFMRLLRFSPIDTRRAIAPVARSFWSEDSDELEPVGRVGSADTIEKHFVWFIDHRMAGLNLPELDSQRLFSAEQKPVIYANANGICGVCNEPVEQSFAEYDHVKPWILGGRTEIENGRPVHVGCHPRGLAALDGRETPVSA
jgi:hypothetical protein